MLRYTARRIPSMFPTLVAISIVTFVVIQLPFGDFLSTDSGSGSATDNDPGPTNPEQYFIEQ